MLLYIPVKLGDVFFVPARMVHAIGEGCLILEVQEPSDFTIQPEHWCADCFTETYFESFALLYSAGGKDL